MRLKTKWLLTSLGGAALIVAILLVASINLPNIGVGVHMPRSLFTVAKVVLWPIAVCLYLLGPRPNVAPAVVAGIALSWTFYSSIVFLSIWFRHRGRLPKGVKS